MYSIFEKSTEQIIDEVYSLTGKKYSSAKKRICSFTELNNTTNAAYFGYVSMNGDFTFMNLKMFQGTSQEYIAWGFSSAFSINPVIVPPFLVLFDWAQAYTDEMFFCGWGLD